MISVVLLADPTAVVMALLKLAIAGALLWFVADRLRQGRTAGDAALEDDVVRDELVSSPVTADAPGRLKTAATVVAGYAWAVLSGVILAYATMCAVLLVVSIPVGVEGLSRVVDPAAEGGITLTLAAAAMVWRWDRARWEARTRLLSPSERAQLEEGSP